MHRWTPLPPKDNSARHRSRIVQRGWTQQQSNGFNEPSQQATTFANGRPVRQFEVSAEPDGILGNGHVEAAKSSNSSPSSEDDDEEVLVVRKVPVTSFKPTVTLNKDGWYDWQIPPSVALRSLSKDDTSSCKLNHTAPTDEANQAAQVDVFTVKSVPNPTIHNEGHEPANSTFYDDFCKTLDDLDDDDETTSEPSRDSFVSVTSAPRIVQVKLPKPAYSQTAASISPIHPSTPIKDEYEDADETPLTQNHISPSSASHNTFDGEELHQPADRESCQTVDEEDLSAIYYAAVSAPSDNGDTRPSPDKEEDQYADAEETERELPLPVPISSLEHSREQTRRLRLYSTLYADFAKNPWQWHDNREAVRELFPRLQREEAEDTSRQSGSAEAHADVEYRLRRDERERHKNDSGHGTFDDSGDVLHGSHSVLLPGLDTLSSDQRQSQDGRFFPTRHIRLEGSDYCFKCRRHFRNTWRMQSHLADSRIHPYYCRMCTIDYSSFKELYMHYAENPKCRPPELEFGPATPFLQILADYQITGQKEAARLQASADAKEALSQGAYPPKLRKPLDAQARATQTAPGKNSEPPACPICMVPLFQAKEVLATACGHVYCSSCILHYFSKERPNCPKCRTPVSKATLIPLELH